MIFRKAFQQDLDRIEEIYNDIHLAEEQGMLTIGWQRAIYPTRETAAQALARDDLYVEADAQGRIVGSAIINRIRAEGYERGNWKYPADDKEILILHTLVIAPQMHGRGYGSAFVEFYEDLARKRGCRCLRMDTNARNHRARRFYRERGYEEAGIVDTTFNRLPGVQLVLLEKQL